MGLLDKGAHQDLEGQLTDNSRAAKIALKQHNMKRIDLVEEKIRNAKTEEELEEAMKIKRGSLARYDNYAGTHHFK